MLWGREATSRHFPFQLPLLPPLPVYLLLLFNPMSEAELTTSSPHWSLLIPSPLSPAPSLSLPASHLTPPLLCPLLLPVTFLYFQVFILERDVDFVYTLHSCLLAF